MEITKCKECGHEISIKTSICPGCGENIGIEIGGFKGLIRRFFLLILALYILLTALNII